MKEEKSILNSNLSVNNKVSSYEKAAKTLVSIGAIILLTGMVIFYIPEAEINRFGVFGEFFGGIVGSFWALAGVVLFYAALKKQGDEFLMQREQLELQRKELKLQRVETELQRKEFERQTQQLVTQNETLAIQKFENTFFHLLSLHNDIVNSNESRDLGKKWAKSLYVRFIGHYQRIRQRDEELSSIEAVKKAYERFPKRVEYLDRYFNNLRYLINFIDKSNISDKNFYTDVIKAQFTVHELLFFFYYGISDFCDKEYRNVLQNYSMFSTMPLDELIDRTHKSMYSDDAFC